MYHNLQFTYWCILCYIINVKKAEAKAKVKNKEFDYSLYKTPSFRPPAGGQNDNRQAFQCLIQRINKYYSSQRDRMKTGRHFSAILALPLDLHFKIF